MNIHQWYDLQAEIKQKEYNISSNYIKDLLFDVGVVHMRSDVKVGVSLSGGFDSSALLSIFNETANLHQDVNCLSVDFEGNRNYSERSWVKSSANYYNVSYDIVSYNIKNFISDISPLILT